MTKLADLLGWIRRCGTRKEVELSQSHQELEETIAQLAREKEKLMEVLARDRADQLRAVRLLDKHYRLTQKISDMAEQALEIANASRRDAGE